MEEKIKLIVNALGPEKFKFDEPLSYHTALKLSGSAKLFFVALKTSEIITLVTICNQLEVSSFVFGTGTKIPFGDLGFDGVVIKNRTSRIEIITVKGKVSRNGIAVDQAIVEAESGVTMSHLAEFLDKQGLINDEFINTSGSVGGNLFINQLIRPRIESVNILNGDQIQKIDPNALNLGIHVILSVVFRVKAKGEK